VGRKPHVKADEPKARRAERAGAIDVAFADGHVEMVKLGRLWDLNWHLNYQLPP